MASQNLVSQTMAAADVAAAKTAITALDTTIDKYLLNLSKEQREHLPKISTENRAIAADALAAVQNNSSFMPQSFSVAEFAADVKFFEDLYSIYVLLQPIFEKIGGTLMATRSDLDSEMRDVYASAKKDGVSAGLETLVAYIGQRYRRGPKAAGGATTSATSSK